MSLAIKYENADDARMRLRNTVVLYKGEPVYIKEVMPGAGKDDIVRVLIQELPIKEPKPNDPLDGPFPFPRNKEGPEKGEKRKFISSKNFDIAPFKMGYVNAPTGAFYCSRVPSRIQKQGLCNENFKGFFQSGAPASFRVFLRTKEVREMVAGEYPSLEKALSLLNRSEAVAFHRDFCVAKDETIFSLIFLYYKGKKVGFVNKEVIELGKSFVCLKESLNEMNLKIGVC